MVLGFKIGKNLLRSYALQFSRPTRKFFILMRFTATHVRHILIWHCQGFFSSKNKENHKENLKTDGKIPTFDGFNRTSNSTCSGHENDFSNYLT